MCTVSAQLSSEFSDLNSEGNPLDILSRIQRLTKEFPRLQDECEAVFADKQELVDVARRSLLGGSTATLKSLATRLGTNADIPVAQTSVHDALQRWNSSMSLVVGSQVDMINTHELNKGMLKIAVECVDAKRNPTSEGNFAKESEEKENQKESVLCDTKTNTSSRNSSCIDEKEFSKLSEKLRAKCRNKEVNELYKVIVTNCRGRRGTSAALSAPELIALGGKIKHAGDPKLEALRSLKRIKITRDGIALVVKR